MVFNLHKLQWSVLNIYFSEQGLYYELKFYFFHILFGFPLKLTLIKCFVSWNSFWQRKLHINIIRELLWNKFIFHKTAIWRQVAECSTVWPFFEKHIYAKWRFVVLSNINLFRTRYRHLKSCGYKWLNVAIFFSKIIIF